MRFSSRKLRAVCLSALPATLLAFVAIPVQAASVGAAAPGFTLADENGAAVSLADFAGTGVILDFCAFWCGPCQFFYTDIYPAIAGNSLILPVLMEDAGANPAGQLAALQWDNAFPIDQVLHPGGSAATELALFNDYMADQSLPGFPTFVFIDASLTVVGTIVGITPVDDPTWNAYVGAIQASQVVPVPAAAWLFASALAALGAGRTRKLSNRRVAAPRVGSVGV